MSPVATPNPSLLGSEFGTEGRLVGAQEGLGRLRPPGSGVVFVESENDPVRDSRGARPWDDDSPCPVKRAQTEENRRREERTLPNLGPDQKYFVVKKIRTTLVFAFRVTLSDREVYCVREVGGVLFPSPSFDDKYPSSGSRLVILPSGGTLGEWSTL